MKSSFKTPKDASIEEKLMIQYSINKRLISELKKQNFALGEMESLKQELEGKLREKNEKLKSANVDIQELRKELKRFKAGVKDEGYIFVLETYVKEMGLWANFKAWLNKQ